ncbi:MAG: DUF63 family protein [Candidatus Thermoplasmatota archaeon]
MKFIGFLKKHMLWSASSILLTVVGVISLGVWLFPTLFYDNWIWKYYWGPVVADAQGTPTAVYNGVVAHEGYTYVSEFTYGIILLLAILVIYRFLKKLEISIDWRFALALMPYIVFGPVARVLEDSSLFQPPWVYWFISPLIYVVIAVFALIFLFLGYYLQKNFDHPYLTVNSVLFTGGLILLFPSLFFVARWVSGDRWAATTGVNFEVLTLVLIIVSLVVFLVYLFAHLSRSRIEEVGVYMNPLNLSMLFGHLIDGVTSYISIVDPLSMGLSYSEKHPASNLLLETWGPLFPIVKFLLIIVVIYVFDVLYKDELKQYGRLVNLLKIGILILGFSPGLRDLLRVIMGV